MEIIWIDESNWEDYSCESTFEVKDGIKTLVKLKYKTNSCFRCWVTKKELRKEYYWCSTWWKNYWRHLFTITEKKD